MAGIKGRSGGKRVGAVGSFIIESSVNDRRLVKKRDEFVKNNIAEAYANYSNYFKIK